MLNVLAVGLGGFFGSIARYSVYLLLGLQLRSHFPFATVIVNVVGCLVIGLITGFAERHTLHPTLLLLLTFGLTGGFTTFSAFSLETFALLRAGQTHTAFLNLAISTVAGIGAAWLGYFIMADH
jgi:CrcB protein